MHKSATKCNETIGKWCKNKHGASKIIDTFETYHGRDGRGDGMSSCGDAAGRGLGGRGNGEWKSWRFNAINRVDDELTDTATSPSKDAGMEPA
jgi:hypothetical protein